MQNNLTAQMSQADASIASLESQVTYFTQLFTDTQDANHNQRLSVCGRGRRGRLSARSTSARVYGSEVEAPGTRPPRRRAAGDRRAKSLRSAETGRANAILAASARTRQRKLLQFTRQQRRTQRPASRDAARPSARTRTPGTAASAIASEIRRSASDLRRSAISHDLKSITLGWHAALHPRGIMFQGVAGNFERYMTLLSDRQKLVASNIANADTPGYHTQDIDFRSEFENADGRRNSGGDRAGELPVKPTATTSIWIAKRACWPKMRCGFHRHQLCPRRALRVRSRDSGRQELMSLFRPYRSALRECRRSAQRTELLVENLANSDTTRTPEGGPYRRKDVVFASDPIGGAVLLDVRKRNESTSARGRARRRRS